MNKQDLIAAMNEQLSAEYQAIVQYLQYSAIVTGPHRPELASIFRAEIPDEQSHAQYLADKIAALGGVPTTTANPVQAGETPQQLLENALKGENEAIEAYTNLIDLAEKAGEIAIRIQMENFVQDESSHRDEILKILQGVW